MTTKHLYSVSTKLVKLLVLISFLANSHAHGQSLPDLTGVWRDKDHSDKRVNFTRTTDGLFDGQAVNGSGQSVKPGEVIFRSLRWNASTQTFAGTILEPGSSKTLPISLSLPNQDTFTFVVHKFFLRKTFTFVRVR